MPNYLNILIKIQIWRIIAKRKLKKWHLQQTKKENQLDKDNLENKILKIVCFKRERKRKIIFNCCNSIKLATVLNCLFLNNDDNDCNSSSSMYVLLYTNLLEMESSSWLL